MSSVIRSRLPRGAAALTATMARLASRASEPAPSALTGGALLGLVCGFLIALTGLTGFYLCLSLIGAALILFDFRIGVVLLILLMPISGSSLFPHEMLGITGLNPLNLLLAATLGSYLLQALFDGTIRRFLPAPLLWLYILPILAAGTLGARHVAEIVPDFYIYEMVSFSDPAAYLRDMAAKPLLMVVFALLVGAAAARSNKPERFLIPAVVSIWVMGIMVIVFVYVSGGALDELARATSREFLSALGIHANELGRLYAVAYALLLFTWAESESHTVRLALVASMIIVMAALLLTFSRSAFAGLMIVNLLYLLWRPNARALIYLGLLAAVGLFALPDAVFERAMTGFGNGFDAITAGRLNGLWLPLVPEVLNSPVFGSGLGSILWSEPMQRAGGASVLLVTHPHNAYLQTLLDMGIVGLVLLCAYFAHVWKTFLRLSKDAALSPALRGFYTGAAAGLLSFLIAALFDGALTPKPEQAFMWLAIGTMYGQLHHKDTIAERAPGIGPTQ